MEGGYNAFGDYLLLKERSADGLGTLWRAGEMERSGFKRIVWLRRFDQPGLDRAALTAEMPVVRQLSQAFKSTNVVRNTECGSEDGVPYLVWDYVPAQPLDRLLDRVAQEQFPVAIDNALLLADKMAAALSAALSFEMQGAPLVHGFLVPQLVLVGNDGEAMVAGFGLAKGLLANLDRVAVQETAAPYLAPEVLATYNASRRSDVYSLGAILYQLLCGTALPADPGSRAAALESPQLAADEGPVPEDVLGVLRRALAARPEERYSSVADFKRELEKLLYGGAYSPTTFNLALFMDRLYRQDMEEEDRELQRERGIDVAAYSLPARAAGEEASASTPAARNSRTPLYIAVAAAVVLAGVVAYLLLGRSAPPPQPDVAELIQSEVTRQLAEKEQQLRADLDREKQETERLRAELDQAKTGKGGQTSPNEARKRTQELEQQLAAREAEQRRKEAELRKVQEQRTQGASEKVAAVTPTAPPAVRPTVAPAAAAATPKPGVEAKAEPTAAPSVSVEPAAAGPAAVSAPVAPAGLGTAVQEGDLVDATQVDVAPQVLVTEKPTFTRLAARSKARGVVILSVLVNEKGAVTDVKVLRPFPATMYGIDEACIKAARAYRFRPATKNGVNVKTWATLTFSLDFARVR